MLPIVTDCYRFFGPMYQSNGQRAENFTVFSRAGFLENFKDGLRLFSGASESKAKPAKNSVPNPASRNGHI
jgi:hypothetical protein